LLCLQVFPYFGLFGFGIELKYKQPKVLHNTKYQKYLKVPYKVLGQLIPNNISSVRS